MGELGSIRRYSYWSDRRIRSIAEDNGIGIEPKSRWTAKSPSIPFFPTMEIARDTRSRHRGDIADRLERAIGQLAVTDFVTPAPVSFAKGKSWVEFALFAGTQSGWDGVVVHTSLISSTGSRVEVCLFGSKDNMAEFAGASDKTPSGWSSSTAYAIEEFLRSQQFSVTPQWDDPEDMAMEALKISRDQGITGRREEHVGKPETRGYTLSHARDAEWFAEIYLDVPVDQNRWLQDPNADRILIGAPLWVRTPSVASITRYNTLR